MSSEKYVYLGGYIELPPESLEHQWPDLADYIKIHVDEFIRIPESTILISNYCDVNYANEQIQVLNLSPDLISLINLKFEVTHAKTLKEINNYYKDTLVIKVGLISYWR